MTSVLIFSGTTEGRAIARHLASRGVDVHVRVATEYGGASMSEDGVDVRVGSCGGADGIAAEASRLGCDLVVDATHPYAARISRDVRDGCAKAGVQCVRVLRDGGGADGVVEVASVQEAVNFLKARDGRILASTGSKELQLYAQIPGYRERVVARVLSARESLEKAVGLGFEGANLIAAQGPFTEEENLAALRRSGAKWLVTKDSGSAGGFEAKIAAARRAGAGVVLVGRPEDSGLPYAEAVARIEDALGLERSGASARRTVHLIGIGMGPGDLTLRAAEALSRCTLAIGAGRMLDSIRPTSMETFEEYRSEEVARYLDGHPEHAEAAVLLSGDTGFYSGATRLIGRLDGYDVDVQPGVSTVVHMAARLGTTWEDALLTSAHGRDSNIVGLVATHPKVFAILSGGESVREMCRGLALHGLDVEVAVGEDFGYPTERIVRGTPAELAGGEYGDLCAAMIFNGNPDRRCPLGIPDELFVRGDAPMTKSEVRTLSVAKLKLEPDSVVYDVGAGTGSVSVEAALAAPLGRVYAIEKEEAACGLVRENALRFRAANVEVVQGTAPEALGPLPAPTHAFIGGSSGNLAEILRCVLSKNPGVRVVVTSVTLETMGETMRALDSLPLAEEETVCVNVSRARRAGPYHLMTAQNPVYITVARGT